MRQREREKEGREKREKQRKNDYLDNHMYMNEGERNGSTLLAINIFILVTSILLQKLFPRRVREWKGDRLEFNGCRVARNLENINAFPWPYTSLILGLLYPTGVIVMEVFQLQTNLIFQAGADGAL